MQYEKSSTYVLGVARYISQSSLSGDSDEILFQLLGRNVRNSVGRVFGRLHREEISQKTGDVWRRHGSSGDGVRGVFAANPSRLDVETGSKDVVAFPVVGEVRTLISKSGSTNGYGFGCGRRRVVARIGVVVAGSNGEMNASINSGIDGEIKSDRLATTKTHVGGTSLETLLTLLVLCSLHLLRVADGGPFDTLDNIGHGTRPV